ncbi:hypothetical protein Tco_0830816 [Tanacetum coccineum]
MDDPNMTMKEYIKFEEEKAHRRGRVFNWKTATYGKVKVDDSLYNLGSVEDEFPTIVIDDTIKPQDALPCKSQVSAPGNDEIDFRISFNESDDEDYTIICDINLFSYKMIYVNNLKTNLENDNEKAGIPSFPPHKPTTSYIHDLDFFNDFKNKFPAIVYNNAQTSKSDLLTEPILNPRHINEFNNETSVSEYDEEEQNILYFNDIFPFNIIRPNDLKSGKDKNDNDVAIIHSSEGNEITHRTNMLMDTSCDKIDKFFNEESFVLELNVNIVTWTYLFNGMLLCFIMNLYVPFSILFDPKRKIGLQERIRRIRNKPIRYMAPLPPREQRHLFLKMRMEHRDDAGVVVFTSRAWGRLFDTRGPLVGELILEFLSTLRFRERQFILALGLHTEEEMESLSFARKEDLHDYWRDISTDGDFLGPPPPYTLIRDPVLRLCHRMMAHSIAGRSQAPEKVIVTDLFYLRGLDVGSVNIPYLLARYLRRFAVGRKSGAHIFGGKFVARLAEHFGLLTAEILGRLTIIAPEFPIIDMAELAVLAPVHAPQQPPPPPPGARSVSQRLGRLEEDVQGLRRDVGSLRGLVERSMTN